MRILSFMVRSFTWTRHAQTLEDAPPSEAAGAIGDGLVAFVEVEAHDLTEEGRRRALRQGKKHLKWLANKMGHTQIVLHSFGHLGGARGEAMASYQLLLELGQSLRRGGYSVDLTPFGWVNTWTIDVRGESLAKVYKAIGPKVKTEEKEAEKENEEGV